LFHGLALNATNAAIEDGNGQAIVQDWRRDNVAFWNLEHSNYFPITTRLLYGREHLSSCLFVSTGFVSDVNGFQPENIVRDLTWNRTVNVRGGAGNNIGCDQFNELTNRKYAKLIFFVPSNAMIHFNVIFIHLYSYTHFTALRKSCTTSGGNTPTRLCRGLLS
jgi:hypothetical protein